MKTGLPVPKEIRSFSRRLFGAGLALGSLIALIGFFHLRNEQTAARQAAGEELDAIANLKTEQILAWRHERLGEARFLLNARGVVEDIVAFAAAPEDPAARARVLGWLEPIKGGTRYESIRIFTPQGDSLLALPDSDAGKISLPSELMAQSLASREPVFTDLHRDPESAKMHVDLLVAIRAEPANGAAVIAPPAPVAVIVLRLDPRQVLFPLVQSWPLPSATAENVLVRREGNEVVYLSELRHRPQAALNLRRPINDPSLPAALGARGAVGLVEGQDYRGVAVLATLRPIHDSPWVLVCKIDQAEIYAPLRQGALLNGALIALILLAITLTGVFLWRQRFATYMRRALAAEKERNTLSERLALITRHANDIILLFDEDRRIVEANERALAAYDRTLEEMRRLKAEDLRASSSIARVEADYTNVLQTNGITFETIHRRKDGTEFPVEVSARMVRIDGRRHILSIVRDITERKRTEASLRHSEEWHRAILKTAMSGFWLTDLQGRFLEVNEAYCQMSGFSASELLTMRIADVEAHESPEETLAHVRKIMALGDGRFETRQRRKDGVIFDVEVSVQYHAVDGGRLVVFLHDITARKKTEMALRESEEKHAKVFQRAPVLIVLSDMETGRCLEVNDEVLRLSGFAREEVIGRTTTELGWLSVEARIQLAQGVRQQGRVDDLEMTFRTKTGELRNGLVNAESILIGGRSCLLTVTVDVTEHTRAEVALRESEEKFATAFRDSPVPMGIRDLETDCYLDVNDRCLAMMGYDRTEVIGRSPLEIGWMAESDRETTRLSFASPGNVNGCELHLRRKDGTPLTCSFSAHVITIGGRPCVLSTTIDITERKRAEAALAASEQNYRRLFDGMLDGFALHEIICDETGRPVDYRFLSVNPAFERLTGLRAAATVGRTLREILPQSEQSWIDRYGRVALTGEGIEFQEYSSALKKHFEIAAFRPNPGQFATVFIDITEQKRAEEALRESEQRYRTILNASPDDVTLADLDGRVLMVSPAGRKMFGYEKEEEFLLRPVTDALAPEDRSLAASRIALMFQGIMPGVNQYTAQRRDGTLFDMEVNSDFIRDASGKPTHLIFVARDVTVRKQTEEALAKANDRLSLATRAGGVGIWDYDVRNNRLVWDNEMYRLYGITADQFEGAYAAWQKGVHPDDRERSDAEIQAALRGEKDFDTEFRVLWPDGSVHHIRALARVKRDGGGQPLNMIGTNWEITAQKHAEESLQTSLHEKEALLKEVHHRVKNNLQVITSLLRLESGRSKQSAAKSVLEDMQGRIRSMAMLHEALYRSGTFAAVDLGVYLKQITTQLYRALVPTPGAIQLQLDLAAAPIDMDQAMPCGLLVNELVSNAFKHGFPHGRTGEVRVDLHRVAAGHELRLTVSDTGIGLPEDLDAKRGQSLGLQLVSDLTRQVDGVLEIGPGPGTSFTITFTPRLSPAAPVLPAQST